MFVLEGIMDNFELQLQKGLDQIVYSLSSALPLVAAIWSLHSL